MRGEPETHEGAATDPGGGRRVASAAVVWISCGGCDGCTMSVLGATSPTFEELLTGSLTHIPEVRLIHPVLSLESGEQYIQSLEEAARGQHGPFVLVVEGSMLDDERAGVGAFSGLGARNGQPIPAEEWVVRIAPRAEAVVAIGSCAAWGGVPAARGNPTGATGLGEVLGPQFRSAAGLPLINFPGCAPSGDAFIETISSIFLHLGRLVPLNLDAEGRPAWLYDEWAGIGPPRLEWSPPGEPRELTLCCVPSRGWINGLGGCAEVGGTCNGCTRSDFPDATLPETHPIHVL